MRMENYFMSIAFSEKEMNEMEEILRKFISDNNISYEVPIDIFNVASKIGFDIRGTEFNEKLEGLILVDETVEKIAGFNSNKIIAYDCHKDINHKKFIVAHELAHYIEEKFNNLNSKIVVAARDHEEGYSENKDEQRKDYIAAALLVPRSDLLKRFPKDKTTISENFYQEVSDVYNVSYYLAKRRVHEVYYG